MNHSGPGVYIFKNGPEPLYVGSTKDLSKRPAKRDKSHASRWSAILESNSVELIPCDSRSKAYQLEEQLVRQLKPKFNLRQPLGQADIERTARIIRENW